MADYQRSIDGLKNQIIEKQEMITEFEKRLTKLISQNEQLERERGECVFTSGCGLVVCVVIT